MRSKRWKTTKQQRCCSLQGVTIDKMTTVGPTKVPTILSRLPGAVRLWREMVHFHSALDYNEYVVFIEKVARIDPYTSNRLRKLLDMKREVPEDLHPYSRIILFRREPESLLPPIVPVEILEAATNVFQLPELEVAKHLTTICHSYFAMMTPNDTLNCCRHQHSTRRFEVFIY